MFLVQCSWHNTVQHPTQNCKHLFDKTCLIRQAQLAMEVELKSKITSFQWEINKSITLRKRDSMCCTSVSWIIHLLWVLYCAFNKMSMLPNANNFQPKYSTIYWQLNKCLGQSAHSWPLEFIIPTYSSSFADAVILMNAGFLQIVKNSNRVIMRIHPKQIQAFRACTEDLLICTIVS